MLAATPQPAAPQPDPMYDLAQSVALTLDCLKAASQDSHCTPEARAAQRYLYERIMNYYAMMRSRSLTKSIEFLTPYSDGKRGATTSGWYYKGAPDGARNWIGPFSSPREAQAARDKDAPKNRIAFLEQQLMALGDDVP